MIDFQIKIIFPILEEGNKNNSKRVNWKLKICPKMKLSWENKFVILFCFPKKLSLSRKIEQKLGQN